MVLWVVTPCISERAWYLRGTYISVLQLVFLLDLLFDPEDGGIMLLWIIGLLSKLNGGMSPLLREPQIQLVYGCLYVKFKV
jgi:hypothetical protein